MSYLEKLFNYSGLSKNAVHRETKITPAMLNKYFAFKSMPNPKTLNELFNLFWKHDVECYEREFIEQYIDLSVNERAYYCFYAVTGKPLNEALGMSRQAFSLWSKKDEIPLKRKEELSKIFEKYGFCDYAIEELSFTKLKDVDAENYNIPADYAVKQNISEAHFNEIGAYFFETPVYKLPLSNKAKKLLIEKALTFSLYDLLSRRIDKYFWIEGVGNKTFNEIKSVHQRYAKEHEAIIKYNAQITLLTPANYINEYINIYEAEFNRHFDYENYQHHPNISFKDDETIKDFLKWDRWELLKRYIEEGEYDTLKTVRSLQAFLRKQLGIQDLNCLQKDNPYSENVPSRYADIIKKAKFESLTEAKANKFLENFHDILCQEQHKLDIRKSKTKFIRTKVDHNFILALDFFAQMHFWVIDNTHENPSKSEPNTMKIISPKGYLNFFKTQTDKPENMQLYLQVFQELEKAKGRFEFLSLDLDISQEYLNLFECSTFEGNTYLASKYNDSIEITDKICIEKDIFESRCVRINGLWDALRISIIIQDSDLLESSEKLKNIIEQSDVSVKWQDLLKCYSVWGQMMEYLSIGDEFLAKDMYKKYNIEGYFIRLIFDEAVSMGVLSKTGKVFKLAKHHKI